jgi:hypothetical protein
LQVNRGGCRCETGAGTNVVLDRRAMGATTAFLWFPLEESNMLHRVLPLLAAFAMICLVAAAALAADETTHEGLFVKAADGKLTMSDKAGKEHSHVIAKDATITCDGKACNWRTSRRGSRSA